MAVGYWNTSAWSINNKSEGNGDVVGVMSDGRSAYTGFLCTDKTGMIDLKTTIDGGWPSALRSLTVKKINDQGYIIGRIDNRACRLVPQMAQEHRIPRRNRRSRSLLSCTVGVRCSSFGTQAPTRQTAPTATGN